MAEKTPGSLPVLVEAAEKYLLIWSLYIHEQGLPVEQETITQNASEIHRYMFVSMRSVGSVGWGWCDQFMSRHGKLT